MPVLRTLDLVLLALALPVFLVADLPILGWVTAVVIWAMWRGIGAWAESRARHATNPKETAGWAAGSMVGRGWLLGLMLLGSGLATDKETGLCAAVLVFVVFTVHFTLKIFLRSMEPHRPSIS